MRRIGYVLSAAGQGFWRNPVMSLASTFTVTLMLLLVLVLPHHRPWPAGRRRRARIEGRDRDLPRRQREGVGDPRAEGAHRGGPRRYRASNTSRRTRRFSGCAISPTAARTSSSPTSTPNLLPASLEIKLGDARQAKRVGDDLRAEIGGGVVADVIDNPQVVDQLLTITRVLSIGGIVILAMMLFVALFVIVNTIRIAVHARRDEIEIMQLVGASDWFVRWPFILEGMLVGALGAVVALGDRVRGRGAGHRRDARLPRHPADLAGARIRVPARRERAWRGAPGRGWRGDAVSARPPREMTLRRRLDQPAGPAVGPCARGCSPERPGRWVEEERAARDRRRAGGPRPLHRSADPRRRRR